MNAATGLDRQAALRFGLLAFATFIFDTLDVCTRLGRYLFQELTGLAEAFLDAWAPPWTFSPGSC